MNPFLRLASGLYSCGTWLDRALTSTVRLPRPVVSVGNIAAGGRGKTPFVIWIAQWLKNEGYQPVVLSRGYGRKLRNPVWLIPQQSEPELDADRSGDEPLEIAALTQAPVLVGADRLWNARRYLERHNSRDIVFILDDGFQHWKIARDLDIVLTTPADAHDRVIPAGRLRESPAALERAQLVLERGRDFEKKSFLPTPVPAGEATIVLTTRAPDPAYKTHIEALCPQARWIELSDHAPQETILARLNTVEARHVLVGAKEAVKLLPSFRALQDFFRQGTAEFVLLDKPALNLRFVGCELVSAHTNFVRQWEEAWNVVRERR